MKRILILICFWLVSLTVSAELIDRIVAVVDSHIITASDMRQEREILERLGEKPVDDDKVLVRQLIDNYLIASQIADSPGADVTDAEIDAELQKSVAREGEPSAAIREAVRLRVRMRKYFDFRFGQYLSAADEDVRKYYTDVFAPAARDHGLNPVPPLEQVTDLIRSNVVKESLNHEINIWLEAIRRKGNIEVFE